MYKTLTSRKKLNLNFFLTRFMPRRTSNRRRPQSLQTFKISKQRLEDVPLIIIEEQSAKRLYPQKFKILPLSILLFVSRSYRTSTRHDRKNGEKKITIPSPLVSSLDKYQDNRTATLVRVPSKPSPYYVLLSHRRRVSRPNCKLDQSFTLPAGWIIISSLINCR